MKYWRVTFGSLADAGAADCRSHYKKSIIVQRVCFSVKTKINGHRCLHARHVWNMIHSFSSLVLFLHKTTVNIKFIRNGSFQIENHLRGFSKFVNLEPSVFGRIKIWYKYKGTCGEKDFGWYIWAVWCQKYLGRIVSETFVLSVLKIRYLWVTAVDDPLFCVEAVRGTAR